MKKAKKNNQFLIGRIKYRAYELRVKGQLPLCLVQRIADLNKDSNIDYVRYLMEKTEHLLRVDGYYKKYSHLEPSIKKLLDEEISKKFGL